MGRIALLDDALINQIAAGEVVERPASVVKELCENALDAGARSIRIELRGGGLERIAITDDGCGMSPEDARLCLERHATSKLRDQAGLSSIATMGFRGEAIPSIASVSRFTLTTREADALAATRLHLEGGTLVEVSEVGAPAGTQVVVEELFFNTPARRKFARRPETELGHVSEAVLRLALARNDVAFQLLHQGRLLFASPAGADPRDRAVEALGNAVKDHLLKVELDRDPWKVSGLVTSPEHSVSTPRGILTFINGRIVRDRSLTHAVGRAFANTLPPGRQPAAVLFLTVPLDAVDVNVHPQKLEVRFVEPRLAQELVVEAVREALRASPWLPSYPAASGTRPSLPPALSGDGYLQRAAAGQGAPLSVREPGSANDGQGLRPSWDVGPALVAAARGLQPLDAEPHGDGRPPGWFSALRYVGQLARTYLVCEAPDGGLVLLDQHAAHERLRFHQLQQAFGTGTLTAQRFLFPVPLSLPLPEARALVEHAVGLERLGVELSDFGGQTVALAAVPALLVGVDYGRLLSDVAQQLAQVGHGAALEDALAHVLATMACHSAVRAHQTLAAEEAQALLRDLDGIDFKTRCPHGRPVAAELSLGELERRVHRR